VDHSQPALNPTGGAERRRASTQPALLIVFATCEGRRKEMSENEECACVLNRPVRTRMPGGVGRAD
jgi:hypothetical protein